MIPFPDLVSRVIQQESGGNPNAVNARTGASGLMQVMPATAADPGFGVKPMAWDQRFDPAEGRRFGEDYLKAMLNRYDGNVPKALAAYNWGPGNADKWSGDMSALPEETRNYITAITGSQGAQPQQPGLMQAVTQPDALSEAMQTAMNTPVPETLSIFGMDTGLDKGKLDAFAQMQQPEMTPMQAPEIRRGPGYVKQTDGLARALEAFNQTKMQRRA